MNIVGNVCAVLFFLLFPSGRFAPRWMRWLAVAFCVYDVTGILVPELYSLLAFLGIVVSLVPDLFLPQVLHSGTTSPDKVGRFRHDPGRRWHLPLPAAGGPLLG